MKFTEGMSQESISPIQKENSIVPLYYKELYKADLSTAEGIQQAQKIIHDKGFSQIRPALNKIQIQELLEHAFQQIPADYFEAETHPFSNERKEYLWALMAYISDTASRDPRTGRRTADEAFTTVFELAKKYPTAVEEAFEVTGVIEEVVEPLIFYEVFIQVIQDKNLKRDFEQKLLSMLEYNLKWRGVEEFTAPLLEKINFTDPTSYRVTGELMHLAMKIVEALKRRSEAGKGSDAILMHFEKVYRDENAIYLLAAKAGFMAERIKHEEWLFMHRNQLFELSKDHLGIQIENSLQVLPRNFVGFERYQKVKKEINTPPPQLVEAAIARGEKSVQWKVAPSQRIVLDTIETQAQEASHPLELSEIAPSGHSQVSTDDLDEYEFLMTTDFREFIENELGVNLATLTLSEQFYFLKFLQLKTNNDIGALKIFIKQYKDVGLRTFLSLEQGGKEMGDKILMLGEKLPEKSARILFSKYGEIVEQVNEVQKYLEGSRIAKTKNETIDSIKNELLIKGYNLLTRYSDQAKICSNSECEKLGKALLRQLSNLKIENHILSATLLFFKRNGIPISVGSLKDIVLEINIPQYMDQHLGPENQILQSEMLNLQSRNYESNPALEEYLANNLIDIFDGRGKHQTEFYILKNNDTVVAFCRFDEIDEKTVYFGSFNVDQSLQKLAIGGFLLRASLEEKAKTKVIKADCSAISDVGARYIESYNFVANNFYNLAGEPSFSIERNDVGNVNLSSKHMTQHEIMEKHKTQKMDSESIFIRQAKNKEDFINYDKFKEGFFLTRYFFDAGSNFWYQVFEKQN